MPRPTATAAGARRSACAGRAALLARPFGFGVWRRSFSGSIEHVVQPAGLIVEPDVYRKPAIPLGIVRVRGQAYRSRTPFIRQDRSKSVMYSLKR